MGTRGVKNTRLREVDDKMGFQGSKKGSFRQNGCKKTGKKGKSVAFKMPLFRFLVHRSPLPLFEVRRGGTPPPEVKFPAMLHFHNIALKWCNE